MSKKCRIAAVASLLVAALLATGMWLASDYMLGYSLSPERDAYDVERMMEKKAGEYPWQRDWLDSLRDHAGLHDLSLRSCQSDSMLHAVYLPAVTPTERTALFTACGGLAGHRDVAGQ